MEKAVLVLSNGTKIEVRKEGPKLVAEIEVLGVASESNTIQANYLLGFLVEAQILVKQFNEEMERIEKIGW